MSKANRHEIEQKRGEYERKLLKLGSALHALQKLNRQTKRELESKSKRYERKLDQLGRP